MKKRILLITFTLILVLGIIWCFHLPYKEVNITNQLQNIQQSSRVLHLKDIYQDKEWDKMIIIKPYDRTTALNENIDMGYAGDRDAILDNTLFDSICTLLFLKDNKLVAFSSVYRYVVDFSKLKKSSYKPSETILIINKTASDT